MNGARRVGPGNSASERYHGIQPAADPDTSRAFISPMNRRYPA